jgi:Tfp pilus assembly protein PilX
LSITNEDPMNTQPLDAARSERGIALIIVLLLLAVMSGLATGMVVNSKVEIAMATNELSYAGARAAAEAGMNRAMEAIMANSSVNLLNGVDGAVDAANPSAAVNADNGRIDFLLGAGPYPLGTVYSYTIQIFDDDDSSLYPVPLTTQLLDMTGTTGVAENGNAYVDTNENLILQVTGYGPNGTVARVARVLNSSQFVPTTDTEANPAILVNGDFTVRGSISVLGDEGNIHANGNLDLRGNAATVQGDATSTGTFNANDNWVPVDGAYGGGRPFINVPDIKASDYKQYADFILTSSGSITTNPLNPCTTGCNPTPTNWTFSGGVWTLAGNSATPGTLYVEGSVSITGNPPNGGGSGNIPLSIIAEGSIDIEGRPKFTPENEAKIQFVTNGDLNIAGATDLDDPTQVEGQIMVREQFEVSGNPEFQGRVMVQNVDGATNAYDATTKPWGRRNPSLIESNMISGHLTVTYNGSLGAIRTTTTLAPVYTNNFSGWIES